MSLSANYMQTTCLEYYFMILLPLRLDLLSLVAVRVLQPIYIRLPITSENDVGAAPSHVGRYRYSAWLTSLSLIHI